MNKRRFGTMIWSNDNDKGFLHCLYVRDFVSDTLEYQEFFVENGHWNGTYHSGVVFCEDTGRTLNAIFSAEALYIEVYIDVEITDYNDVIETFIENLNVK